MMLKKFISILSLSLFFNYNVANANNSYNIFSSEEELEENTKTPDPFEKVNRKIYRFNITLDKYTLKPAAKIYRKTTSEQVRASVNNFTSNLAMPLTMANSLLQGDLKNFAKATGSFVINSTIGILGIFNPAHQNIKLPKASKEDLGQTLAKYGVPSGPYIMTPFFGPFTARSLTGKSSELFHPIWKGAFNDREGKIRSIANSIDFVNQREKLLERLDDIERNSLDPYSVVKSAYYQYRVNLINNDHD